MTVRTTLEQTVKELAVKVGLTPDQLLIRLKEFDIAIEGGVEGKISEAQKQTFLKGISSSRGKITLGAKKTIKLSTSRTTTKPDIKSDIKVTRKRHYKKPAEDAVIKQGLPSQEEQAELSQNQKISVSTHSNKPKLIKPATKTKEKTEAISLVVKRPEEKKKKKKKESETTKVNLESHQQEIETSPAIAEKEDTLQEAKTPDAKSLTQSFKKPVAQVVLKISIPETITIAALAKKMSVKATEVIKVMMKMGAMATINQVIDQETAAIVVEEFGHEVILLSDNELEDSLITEDESGEEILRAPVVTIMGHVDHGKTSLLDYIRRTKVTASESGGITQHIGAYSVETEKGKITFLDTPGHEAFTAMRARGAKLTDIVVLIVAADDGVKPQTLEAIQHAKAAKVPIIVAVNKMDKPEADPERVRTELSNHEVISEEWGGDAIFQNISAKTGDGIDDLLDNILVQAEVLELKAIETGSARGTVIESKLDKGRGPVATILVQKGTLNKNNILLVGAEFGRIRAMLSDSGSQLTSATPSTPVEIVGLSGVPNAGDEAIAVESEKKAREVALFRQGKFREVKFAKQQSAKLENIFTQMNEGEVTRLNILLKADVQGSLEAITEALTKLSTDEVKVDIISKGVGGITESDVTLALASRAIVIGFNVRADPLARRVVEAEEIDLRYYSVIYDLINEVKSALTGMLAPKFEEKITGLAEIREVFRSSKVGSIAGCSVVEGKITRNTEIRILRDHIVIYKGQINSLRRYKEDASEVRQGMECGIGVKDYNDIKVGDQIEAFEMLQVERKLV